MSHVALTGARGFLGWHTRGAALSLGLSSTPIAVGDAHSPADAAAAISGAGRLLHIAGVNRASDSEVRDGNILFATQIAAALEAAPEPPPVVVFANSTQVGNGSIYGSAKEDAASVLREAAGRVGATFIDIAFPNLYGEHGRPFYNSVVSTFCQLVATGGQPVVDVDREMTLLHAQDAADELLGVGPGMAARVCTSSVTEILAAITDVAAAFVDGEVPDLSTDFERNLVNTYRSFVLSERLSLPLSTRDGVELVRSRGGAASVTYRSVDAAESTPAGFHRRAFERLVVVEGEASITLRRLFSHETVTVRVAGDEPVAVEVPTLWTYSVSAVGGRGLRLAAWSTESSDPDRADTVAEPV